MPSKALIGFVFSAICVALGAWLVDWREALDSLRHVHPGWLAAAVATLLASFASYAMRWRALLLERELPFPRAVGYLMVGYMSNAVLPLRPGDLLRAALVSGRERITMAGALSSIALERLLDVLTVVLLGILAASTRELPVPVQIGLATFALAGAVGAGFVLLLSARPDALNGLAARFERGRLRRVIAWLQVFARGLGILRRGRRFAVALFWNALAWGFLVLFLATMLVALEIPAPPPAALLLLVAVSLGGAIPSSPGAIGVYHAVAVLALSAYAVSPARALAFALVTHGITVALHIALGAASASAMGLQNVLQQARRMENG